jgi:hypothetical protein
MNESQSGPLLPTIWLASDGSFDFWLHGALRKPEFYWMFVAVVAILSFGVFMDLEHRLHRAGWQDPIGRVWRRLWAAKAKPAAQLDCILSPPSVMDDQFRRYGAFVGRVKAEYGADFDANIELEFSHFETDGRVVVNAYPKTQMGEAMIGLVRARLERQ